MPTRAEAKEHINSFWTRRHIARDAIDIENDINLRDLSNGLKILSDGLYGDLTHFFWELLQNADDSKYLTVPRVDFVLTSHSLTYETNEIGFTRGDVESLCAVGYSSKAGQNDTIGEKGIGFKSIFKIADVVTIHSGVYSFKLDTRPPLGNVGMVLPMWLDKTQDFPGTSITLQFKADLDVSKLRQHLASFDFTFLLFTRNIKVINLKVLAGQPFEKLGRLEHLAPKGERIETRIDGRPDATMDYVIFRRKYQGMPPRQPGAQVQPDGDKTTIVLAFPHLNHKPLAEGQKTYAYLPVNSFGFQFIIHADFVLTANRKGIDSDRGWNTSLQRCLPEALCSAFEQLATSAESQMRFGWPEYLGSLGFIHDSFMREVADSTIKQLRSKLLVRTELQDGVFLAPQDSLTASDEFRDATGGLLITEGTYAQRVRSNAYSYNSATILSRLGVTPFEISHFVELLAQYISAHMARFSSEATAWHSRVASLLCNHFSNGQYQLYSPVFQAFKALRIIPLDDGSWVSGASCATKKVFMDQGRRIALPTGLHFCFVQASAADDRHRRQLYRLLGVKPCDETEICKMILDSHATMVVWPPLEILISHAMYIFRARYQPQYGQSLRLRLLDSNLTIRYRERVHLPFGTQGKALRRLFADDFSGIIWLHPDYEDRVTEGERQYWFQFLCSVEGVYRLPPLHSGGRLSDAMRHILMRNGSKEFLWLLKTQYRSGYGNMFGDSHTWEAQTLTADISNIWVSTDQGVQKLCETILPSLSPISLGLLPVIQLVDPQNTDWSFLRKFGVQTELSPDFFVKQLRALKENNDQGRVIATATTVYKAIAAYPALDSSKLASFHTESLIYVDPGGWVLPQQCVWKASFPCTKVPVLSRLYRGCDNLFQALLKVRDAGLDDLISELEDMESTRELDRTRLLRQNMLPALDSFLGKASLSMTQRRRLLPLHIFPVTQVGSNDPTQAAQLLRAEDTFWIADLNFLKSKFEGFLPLLDITEKLFKSSIHNVFKNLSMDSKRLSLSVRKEENQPNQGDISEVADPALSNRLRRQSRYIIGIVCHENKLNQPADQVTAMLSNIRVFRVPDITIRRYVLDASTKRYGRDEKGEVLLLDADGELHIKIRRDSETMDIIIPLSDRFAERFHLGNANRELLVKVLTTEKVEQFIEGLERAGIKTDPTTVVEIVAEDSLDEDSDDGTLAEDPSDNLGLAFQKLQISKGRTGSGSDEESSGSQQRRPSQTPSSQGRRVRNDGEVSSPFSLRRRSGQAASGGARSDAIATNGETTTDENIARLTASLIDAKLSDTTHEVFRNWVTPPSGEVPSKSSVPVFGMATAFEFTFNSPSPQPLVNNPDASGSSSSGPNTLATSRHIADNSSEAQAGLDAPQSSPNHLHGAFKTPTKAFRQSNHPWSSGRPPRSSYGGNSFVAQESSEAVPHEIGFAGEHLVYKFLEDKLSPFFTPENWTSRGRAKAFPNPFSDDFREKDFADFTYVDTDGRLRMYLSENVPNFENPTGQRNNITYHLEVKSTLGSLHNPAFLSNNQISMAKKYSGRFSTPATQTDVYILVRVYGLGSDPPQPQLCLFPDPWNLICQDSLLIEGEAGIYVRPKVA
ncbi:uncharacterized protein PV07_01789 [Cladophialophora immunda]|uniref:Sacsin/Nov domain-containing protein n=1 Tax=Cladophialophora immunda TaxID=569365 RepID=A0A0D2DH42_9EURO|nr:uncharacterized protein PV07_01789 [Cladophialophora immunda]KIW35069.1 hypothetical protein PV07_01789 [Cladophialophora immunda]